MTVDETLRSQADYLDALAAAIRTVNGRLDNLTRVDLEARLGVGGPIHPGLGPVPSALFGQSAPGATLGNVQAFFGQSNGISNPELVGIDLGGLAVSNVAQAIGPAWSARYLLNSGTDVAGRTGIRRVNPRGPNVSFNSSVLAYEITALAGAAVRDFDLYCYPTAAFDLNGAMTLPYLTASVRVQHADNVAIPAHWTTADFTLEIVRTSDGVVVASSPTLALRTLGGFESRQLIAATQQTAAAFYATTWLWRLRLHVVSDGSALTGFFNYQFAEPQLNATYTPDAPPFAPLIGRWYPDKLNAYDLGKTFPNLAISNGTGGFGELLFGSGDAAGDVRLTRTATKELTFKDAAAGPVTTKHVGPLFIQGPDSMDLAITYGAFGPTQVTRTDAGLISTTTISYDGTGKITSVVTTRFAKTFTVTPTYTGANITAIHRAVA